MTAQCVDCGREFVPFAVAGVDSAICRRCYRDVVGERVTPIDTGDWRFSRAAMRERLGVTGNEDV